MPRSPLQELNGEPELDLIRGIEGDRAKLYFQAFGLLVGVPDQAFAFQKRTLRPPRDRVNALLLQQMAAIFGHTVSEISDASGRR